MIHKPVALYSNIQHVASLHHNFIDSDVEVCSSEESVDELDLSTSFFDVSGETVDEPLPESSSVQEKLLYEEAPADLTVHMAHVLLFQYSVRHSLTSKAFQELLQLMRVFLPKDAAIPKSVRHLKQFFLKTYTEQCPTMQKYCSLCQRLIDETCTCNAGINKFVTVPVGPQLKSRLESKCVSYLFNMGVIMVLATQGHRSPAGPVLAGPLHACCS